MCTYLTETFGAEGSGKGPDGWFGLTDGSVYIDHPVHAPYAHTVNIDLRNPEHGASARVALELTEESALALAEAIHAALRHAPAGIASRQQDVSEAHAKVRTLRSADQRHTA